MKLLLLQKIMATPVVASLEAGDTHTETEPVGRRLRARPLVSVEPETPKTPKTPSRIPKRRETPQTPQTPETPRTVFRRQAAVKADQAISQIKADENLPCSSEDEQDCKLPEPSRKRKAESPVHAESDVQKVPRRGQMTDPHAPVSETNNEGFVKRRASFYHKQRLGDFLMPVSHIIAENPTVNGGSIVGLELFCKKYPLLIPLSGVAALAYLFEIKPELKDAVPLLKETAVPTKFPLPPLIHRLVTLSELPLDFILEVVKLDPRAFLGSIEPTFGENCIHTAICSGRPEVAMALIVLAEQTCPDIAQTLVKAKDKSGSTPLMWSLFYAQNEASIFLLDKVTTVAEFTDINVHGNLVVTLGRASDSVSDEVRMALITKLGQLYRIR